MRRRTSHRSSKSSHYIDSAPLSCACRKCFKHEHRVDRLFRRRTSPTFPAIGDKVVKRFRLGEEAVDRARFDGFLLGVRAGSASHLQDRWQCGGRIVEVTRCKRPASPIMIGRRCRAIAKLQAICASTPFENSMDPSRVRSTPLSDHRAIACARAGRTPAIIRTKLTG